MFHPFLGKAAKDAGIEKHGEEKFVMSRNYPGNPKQRGAGYWAAYNGSLTRMLYDLQERHSVEIKELRQANASVQEDLNKANRLCLKLEGECNDLRKIAARNGIETTALEEGWSTDRAGKIVGRLVG